MKQQLIPKNTELITANGQLMITLGFECLNSIIESKTNIGILVVETLRHTLIGRAGKQTIWLNWRSSFTTDIQSVIPDGATITDILKEQLAKQ